jgi:molecular chaperone GrpE (heat shock protein)
MSQPLLEGEVDNRDQEIRNLLRKVSELEDELAVSRAEGQRAHNRVERGVRLLRDSTRDILNGLKLIHGEMDAMIPDTGISAGGVAAPQFDPRWDAWKQKLGTNTAPAKVIDALLTHGSLTRTQLRPVCEIGWSTLDAATGRLKNLGLIEKSGDRWILKTL